MVLGARLGLVCVLVCGSGDVTEAHGYPVLSPRARTMVLSVDNGIRPSLLISAWP